MARLKNSYSLGKQQRNGPRGKGVTRGSERNARRTQRSSPSSDDTQRNASKKRERERERKRREFRSEARCSFPSAIFVGFAFSSFDGALACQQLIEHGSHPVDIGGSPEL